MSMSFDLFIAFEKVFFEYYSMNNRDHKSNSTRIILAKKKKFKMILK